MRQVPYKFASVDQPSDSAQPVGAFPSVLVASSILAPLPDIPQVMENRQIVPSLIDGASENRANMVAERSQINSIIMSHGLTEFMVTQAALQSRVGEVNASIEGELQKSKLNLQKRIDAIEQMLRETAKLRDAFQVIPGLPLPQVVSNMVAGLFDDHLAALNDFIIRAERLKDSAIVNARDRPNIGRYLLELQTEFSNLLQAISNSCAKNLFDSVLSLQMHLAKLLKFIDAMNVMLTHVQMPHIENKRETATMLKTYLELFNQAYTKILHELGAESQDVNRDMEIIQLSEQFDLYNAVELLVRTADQWQQALNQANDIQQRLYDEYNQALSPVLTKKQKKALQQLDKLQDALYLLDINDPEQIQALTPLIIDCAAKCEEARCGELSIECHADLLDRIISFFYEITDENKYHRLNNIYLLLTRFQSKWHLVPIEIKLDYFALLMMLIKRFLFEANKIGRCTRLHMQAAMLCYVAKRYFPPDFLPAFHEITSQRRREKCGFVSLLPMEVARRMVAKRWGSKYFVSEEEENGFFRVLKKDEKSRPIFLSSQEIYNDGVFSVAALLCFMASDALAQGFWFPQYTSILQDVDLSLPLNKINIWPLIEEHHELWPQYLGAADIVKHAPLVVLFFPEWSTRCESSTYSNALTLNPFCFETIAQAFQVYSEGFFRKISNASKTKMGDKKVLLNSLFDLIFDPDLCHLNKERWAFAKKTIFGRFNNGEAEAIKSQMHVRLSVGSNTLILEKYYSRENQLQPLPLRPIPRTRKLTARINVSDYPLPEFSKVTFLPSFPELFQENAEINIDPFIGQDGYNCFFIALDPERQFFEQGPQMMREAVVNFALYNSHSAEFRQLLAPEIAHAGMLTYQYLRMLNLMQENVANNSEIGSLLEQLARGAHIPTQSSERNIICQKIDAVLRQLIRSESFDQEAQILPESMRTEELYNIFSYYENVFNQQELRDAANVYNELLGYSEGNRLSLQALLQAEIVHPVAHEVFMQVYQRTVGSAENALQAYCMREDIYASYINSYYAQHGWVAFQRNIDGECSTSFIDIAVRYLFEYFGHPVQIVIYQEDAEIYEAKYPVDVEESSIVFHMNYDGHSHFTHRPLNIIVPAEENALSDVYEDAEDDCSKRSAKELVASSSEPNLLSLLFQARDHSRRLENLSDTSSLSLYSAESSL